MSSTLRGTRLIEVAAPSINYDRQVQAACAAFDEQMFEIIDETGQVIMIPNIMNINDETLIDILAWQFHVDFYDKDRPLEFRKRLVQLSIIWHKTKGTVALVEEVLETYWPGGAILEEWYEYMDPLPPNYPTDDADSFVASFNTSAVDLPNNRFNINAHGLTNGDQIRFIVILPGRLPKPLLEGLYYYVVNALTNSFQVAQTPNADPITLLDVGLGVANEVWERGDGSWHDRYRFRILIDQEVIEPEDEAAVLALIDRYKPVSRWCEGIFRVLLSQADIGWTGMVLRFIYREIDAPDYEFEP